MKVFFAQKVFNFGWPGTSFNLLMSWNSFCLNYNAINGTLLLDVNGKNVLAETIVAESSLLWNGSTLTIGSNNCILVPTSKHFVGKITDFNIWNRSLSQEEMNKFSMDNYCILFLLLFKICKNLFI